VRTSKRPKESKWHVQKHVTPTGWCVELYEFWVDNVGAFVGTVRKRRYFRDEVAAQRIMKKWREEVGIVVIGEA